MNGRFHCFLRFRRVLQRCVDVCVFEAKKFDIRGIEIRYSRQTSDIQCIEIRYSRHRDPIFKAWKSPLPPPGLTARRRRWWPEAVRAPRVAPSPTAAAVTHGDPHGAGARGPSAGDPGPHGSVSGRSTGGPRPLAEIVNKTCI